MKPRDPAFLRFYAATLETEAQKRGRFPEFARWLSECAVKARSEARALETPARPPTPAPVQMELFQ